MKTKNILIYTLLALLFASCARNDDEMIYDLRVEQNAITLSEDATATILITSGNGRYQAMSSNEAVVTVVISSNSVQITSVRHGTATLTITDAAGKRATITVTVTSRAIADTALRFEWDGTRILLDQANGWSVVQNFPTAGNIGVVNLYQRQSLRTTGITNYNVGVKSNVRLHIIENGGEEQTIPLDMFEIVENQNGIFTAVGNVGDRRLVIRYWVN